MTYVLRSPHGLRPCCHTSLVADIAVMLKAGSECETFMPAFSLWKKL
jgi:hypothetical protein